MLGRPDGDARVDELVVLLHEIRPFVILGHCDRSHTEILDGSMRDISLSLENAGIRIVGFLDFSNDD